MTTPRYFLDPFAVAGDLTAVPNTPPVDGTVNYDTGFPPGYSTPVASGGLIISRQQMNQILNDITLNIQNWWQNCIPPFITSADNGGSPYSYSQYALVMQGGVAYQSLVNSNTTTPPGANWIVAQFGSNLRASITSNTTYYVATTGSDSNAGTSGSPWLTLQHAWNYITNSIDQQGFTVTLQIADGTYTAGILATSSVTGPVIINGDSVTPSNVILSTTNANCLDFISSGFSVTLQNFKMQTTTGGNCVQASGASNIIQGVGIVFGACAGYHVECQQSASYDIIANYTISGSASVAHWGSSRGANVNIESGLTITLTGTPSWGSAFALANSCGTIIFLGTAATFSGSATGSHYNAQFNGVINTNGQGSIYLPGSTTGSATAGGQYN